jgi:hypothetical protein
MKRLSLSFALVVVVGCGSRAGDLAMPVVQISGCDADALIAVAKEGTEAIRRCEYLTISNTEGRDALWQRIWSRTAVLANDIRATPPWTTASS